MRTLKSCHILVVRMRECVRAFSLTALLLLFLPACVPGQSKRVELGFSDCHAVVFVTPEPGMSITLSAITYDGFGYVSGFRQEMQYSQSKPIVIVAKVDNSTWRGDCGGLRWEASVDGKRILSPLQKEFKADALGGLLAFYNMEIGGLWVAPGGVKGGLESNFDYDSFGRRQMAHQQFQYNQTTYEIAYSGYTRDSAGRITGYKAAFKKQ